MIMKNLELMTKASRMFGRAGLQIKKHSPEIFMVAGVVGTVASTVLACKATTKVSKIMEEKDGAINDVHRCLEEIPEKYTEEDSKKDLTIVYAQTGVKLVKLYAPAAILGALSITSIVAGQRILKKRNIALAAAYTVVDKSFKDYRKNVVERFGEQIDNELRYNIKAKEIEEIVTDENGETKVEKKVVDVIDSEPSEFAKFFDEGCCDWSKDPNWNLMFLRRQQDYANELLRSRGHVFLNEVYDMLDIPRTPAGQVVGWIYDPKNTKTDSYIDFGIYKNTETHRNFVNGYERTILLDFNVDGPIQNLI